MNNGEHKSRNIMFCRNGCSWKGIVKLVVIGQNTLVPLHFAWKHTAITARGTIMTIASTIVIWTSSVGFNRIKTSFLQRGMHEREKNNNIKEEDAYSFQMARYDLIFQSKQSCLLLHAKSSTTSKIQQSYANCNVERNMQHSFIPTTSYLPLLRSA